MKAKNSIHHLVFWMFALCLFLSLSTATAQEKEQETQAVEQIRIPQQVKVVLQEGLTQRQGRLDIPFSLIKHLYFPAQLNMHSIFFFKMKNADLGFVPKAITPVEEKTEEAEEETEAPPDLFQTSLNVFLQFHRVEEEVPVEVIREVYIPVNLEVESTSYDPEKEEIYSTAYPLLPGDYLLAMAVTSLDLKKIGTNYYEFSLPDASLFTDKLETTPIFFLNNFKQMDTPETTAEVHKNFFTYSILQIEPKIENVFSQGENLDVFFFIFGTQPDEEGNYAIGINYEVNQEEKKFIRFEAITCSSPLISQPLPMKRTFLIKSEEGEKKERKDLDPGHYTLTIKIKDNVTGKTLDRNIDFEIK